VNPPLGPMDPPGFTHEPPSPYNYNNINKDLNSINNKLLINNVMSEKIHPVKKKALQSVSKKSKPVYLLHSLSKYWANPVQEQLIDDSVKDMTKWREVVEAWLGVGYKAKNVTGMVDWYLNGIQRYNKVSQPNTGNGGRNFLDNIGEHKRSPGYYKNVKTTIINSGD